MQDPRRRPDPSPTPEPPRDPPDADDREGATERDVGDRVGPGAGYDNEPEQEPDRGGVS
jgi:hypothetical protein